MPRDRSLRSELVKNGFVASASIGRKIDPTGQRHKVETDDWQQAIWQMFDSVGEFRAGITWIANQASKAKLYAAKDGKRTEDAKALEPIAGLYGGEEGHAEMFGLFATHLNVGGDSYLVGWSGLNGGPDEWDVVSNLKVKKDAGRWKVEDADREDEPVYIQRLHRRHPLHKKKGDAASRSALPILRELFTMTQRVAADSDSRLTGAGLLLVPSEVEFPASPVVKKGEDGKEVVQAEGAQGLQDLLIDVASISIADQTHAVAKVPIVVSMPGEHIKDVQHIDFWTSYDKHLQGLRDEAIRRLALTLDMPPEALLGTSGMNHWGAWQMEEASIKIFIEPLLDLITSTLTEVYYRPALVAAGMSAEDAESYTLEADITGLKLRPNRSKEAFELYDRGVLNEAALLRENGFAEEDAMDDDERKGWLLRRVASGSTTPEQVAAALRELGITLGAEDLGELEATAEGTEAPQQPSLQEHPVRALPQRKDEPITAAAAALDQMIAVSAASDVVVLRALERVGNRLKSRGIRPDGVKAVDLYRYADITREDAEQLLEDAWSTCDRLDTPVPVSSLHAYTRGLLTRKKAHSPELMREYLLLEGYVERTGVAEMKVGA